MYNVPIMWSNPYSTVGSVRKVYDVINMYAFFWHIIMKLVSVAIQFVDTFELAAYPQTVFRFVV